MSWRLRSRVHAILSDVGLLVRGPLRWCVVLTPAGRRVVSTTTAAALRQMLLGLLTPGGTASELSVPASELAGQTGVNR